MRLRFETAVDKSDAGLRHLYRRGGYSPGGTMHYGISTKLPPDKVIEKAVEYFSKLGLKVRERTDSSLFMEGTGGYIDLGVCGGDGTDVDVVTQEWNEQVKQFLQRLA
jgi:hypothetical protein